MSKNQLPSLNKNKNETQQQHQSYKDDGQAKNQKAISDYYGISDNQTNYETQTLNQTNSQFGMRTFYHTVQRGFFNNKPNNRVNSSQSVRSNFECKPNQIQNQSKTQQGFNTFLSPNDNLDNQNQYNSAKKQGSQFQISRKSSQNTGINLLSNTNINFNSNNNENQSKNGDVYNIQRRNTQQFYDTYFQPIFKGDDMGGIQPNLPEGKSQLPEIDYKTQFEFNNTQQNQHLFFLNFMHDQNNPPKHKKNIQIPSEEEINQQFQFKISRKLQDFENPTSTLSFLNSGWEKDIRLIEDYIDYGKRKNQELVDEKAGMKEELEKIKQNYDVGLDEIKKEFTEKMQKIPERLKEDFIQHQNEQFRLNKEIAKLNKDKGELNAKIDQVYTRLQELETQMFGFPVFELQANDPNLDNICSMNLRNDTEAFKKTQYPKLFH